MDLLYSENVTLRKHQLRSSSLNDLTTSTNNSTYLETTAISLPNTSLDESHTTNKLHDKINKLQEELQSANNEIEKLSLENSKLSRILEKSNKTIELYKTIGISDAKCTTPLSQRKLKSKARGTISILNTPSRTPVQKTEPIMTG